MLMSRTRVCIVYVVKEVTSFHAARSINGMVCKRTHDPVTDQQRYTENCNYRKSGIFRL